MPAFIKFFSAPLLPDEETNRRAGLLSFILNLHILTALSTTLIFILFISMPPIFPLAAFLASLPGFGLRAMLRQGYVKSSSVMFVSMVILIMPALAWFSGYSVASVPITVFQCITVVMAGLLLGRWGAVIFVASTAMLNGALIYAELQGLYSTDTSHNPILAWSMQVIAFSAIASMLYVTNRLIGASFRRAQKENDQRRAREQELEQVIQAKTQTEAALKKSAERLEILHDIDRALLTASSPQAITQTALARIRQLIPCPRASVTLFDFAKNEAIFLAADSDKPSSGAEGIITLQGYGQYVIDELQKNQPCIVNDTRTHPAATELDKHLAEDGLPSWLYLPLLYQGQLIGALNLGRAAENFFTTTEADMAFGIANQLAVVVRQSRLYEDLQNELTERKQTEEKLVNSEARLRALVENSPDLILEVNRQGEILFINRFTENYLGKNVREVLPPDQVAPALEIIDKAFDTGQFQALELQTFNPLGKISWDSIRIGPVKQGDRVTSLTLITTDITLQKQTEAALQRSESIYRQAIMSAGAVPYVLDHATHTLTFIGEGILAMTGYSAFEMTNSNLWNSVVLEGIPRGNLAHLTYEEANRITDADNSIAWECDYRIRTRDGQTRWIADTSVKGFDEKSGHTVSIGIKQDITERKEIEQQMQQRLQELAVIQAVSLAAASELESDVLFDLIARELFELFDIQEIYFALHDRQTDLIQFPYYRHGDERIETEPVALGQGLSSRVILSRQPLLINEEYEQRSAELGVVRFSTTPTDISRVSWLGVPIQAGEQTIGVLCVMNLEREKAFTDDDVRLLTTIAANVGIAIQNAQLYMAVQQELTGRKQAEAEREAFIQELEAKNAELERFNYTVSHELKSPIVTIKGFLGSVAKDLQDGKYERAQKDLLRVSNATDKMHDTLADLLELSRIGRVANPPEAIDLSQLAQEALETVHGRIQARNITVQIAPDLPVIVGDRVRLREVYENLLDNAAKHFGAQPAPLIEVGSRKAGDEIICFVKDNGMGIEEKYHKRIFGLFDKLDAASEGTGIGLAIVKRIIETHGGKIWVESEGLGKGSTFCFTIPDGRQQDS